MHRRSDQLEGRRYNILRAAAEALAADYPGAATLLYRKLVSSVLDRATSKYYPYAARDYQAAAVLDDVISDDASAPSHGDWISDLRRQHGRKIGFWSLVEPSPPR